MAEINNFNQSVERDILDINENLSKSESLVNNEEHESVSHETDNSDFQNCQNLNPSYCVPEIVSEVPKIVLEVSGHLFENINNENCDMLCENSSEVVTNRNSDSGVHDTDNFFENSKLIDFNSTMKCNIISEFANEENCVEVRDEEFHDAVQFFKDPSALTFLENAGASSTPAENPMTRSSLYVNFDPLHAKFFSHPNETKDLQNITECEFESENTRAHSVPDNPEISNKPLRSVTPRTSLGRLISFDSPAVSKNVEPDFLPEENSREPPTLYSEEELQQALKLQELRIQETFLKRQHDLETERTQKIEELESKIKVQKTLNSSFHAVLIEFAEVAATLSDQKSALNEKLEKAEEEIIKLKEDLKTSAEDLQSVECTFSDFHKRYEQCKSMLKVYTQNEDNLKRQLDDAKLELQDKEEMFKALQTRTQEMLDKANTEVSNAKKAGDAQVAVLNAQLKKAELKISSLESDVKQVKIENDKLSSICDDLMTKVSES